MEQVRADVIDGLATGDAAEQVPTFHIGRQPDGSLVADYGDEGHVYVVSVVPIARETVTGSGRAPIFPPGP